MTSESLCEYVSEAFTAGTKCVDGVVRNVKILGKKSKNKGGVYPVEVMRESAHLYDGAKVNIDHVRGDDPRTSVHDRFGVIRNPRVEGEEIRGDLHFNPKHHSAEQFAWAVENQPETIGFSHIAKVDWKPIKGGGRVATKIHFVKSVDVVADPATTAGVFEDVDPDAGDESNDELPLTGRSRALSALSDDQFAFVEAGGKKDGGGRTTPRSKRLFPLDSADAVRVAMNAIPKYSRLSEDDRKVAMARAVRAGARFKITPKVKAAATGEENMGDLATLTVEELRAARPDLLDSLSRENESSEKFAALTKEHEALKVKFATMEAAEKKRQRAGEIDEALAEAGLDPANPRHVGKTLRRVLESIEDPKELKETIEERRDELAAAGLLDAEADEADEPETHEAARFRTTKPFARAAGNPGAGKYEHADSKDFMKSLRA